MVTSLVSLMTNTPVKDKVAMTGEITLRGRVLPVGGIRDKVLAAQRAGIQAVILPARNEKDLEEVPAHVKKQIEFHAVDHFDQALEVVQAKPRRRVRAAKAKARKRERS